MRLENKTEPKGIFKIKNPQPATWFVIILLFACAAALVTGLILNSQGK